MSFGAMLERIREALRSPRCLHCDAPQNRNIGTSAFCNRCHERLGIRPPQKSHPDADFPCYAAVTLNAESKRLLYGYKFHGRKDHEPVLARLLSEAWQRLPESAQSCGLSEISRQPAEIAGMEPQASERTALDSLPHPETVLVVPVPPRGDKPSRVDGFARRFARHFGYDYASRVLRWQRETVPQHTLHERQARLLNIAGGLTRNLDFESPHMQIIVVDDLTTTGATLRESVRALRENILPARQPAVTALTVAAMPFSHSQRSN